MAVIHLLEPGNFGGENKLNQSSNISANLEQLATKQICLLCILLMISRP